jgi:hypothetical protein
MIQPSVPSSRIWNRTWDVAFVALVIGLASFASACETNACLPSTTCVNGPVRSETFSAAVPASDAATEDAADAADANVESGSSDAAEPSEGEAESPDDASGP